VLGEFDLVWAVNDTLNYLLSGEELQAGLRAMAANLAAGGVILFDLNSLGAFRTGFAQTHTRNDGEREMTWTGRTAADVAPGSICEAQIDDGDGAVATHVHRQRHFPEAEVRASLEACGLECLEVWGELEGELSQPLDEGHHTKAVYIARPSGGG